MRDFTLKTYKELIKALKQNGYAFQTFEQFNNAPKDKVVVLRHDCDIWVNNDLDFAKIESKLGISSTYFFRIPKTFKHNIITKIRDLGHEIGYHYEDLAITKGDFQKAHERFKNNLELLRLIYPVTSIAMHGSPLSKWDSKKLWEQYSLQELGVRNETNISFDFDKILYLTDTGSKWNGDKEVIRDTVESKLNYNIETTFGLIRSIAVSELPNKIIINSHAARWNNNYILWLYRLILQKSKNFLKRGLKLLHEYK